MTHLIDGEFQSDKYPTTPRGKVPLSVKDRSAQDLLWEYAQRRRGVDAEFSRDLETALRAVGYETPHPAASFNAQQLRFGYLLWNTESNCWWKPNRAGYTGKVEDAGRYTLKEALVCSEIRSPGVIPSELIVLSPELRASLLIEEDAPNPNDHCVFCDVPQFKHGDRKHEFKNFDDYKRGK